jgi:Glycosyl transferase family 2
VTRPDPASPSVAVIIPTYQRREYVTRAVRSVLAQTFSDFELIVVDDGSTDGTGDVLAGLDPRLRYHWQENRGTGAARNAGIALARGEIVAFLDSDNRWLPGHLAVVTEVLALHPPAILTCTCPLHDFGGRQHPLDARLVDALPLMLADGVFAFISCVAVRAAELRAVGGFAEDLLVGENNDLLLRLAVRGPFAMLRHRTTVIQHTRGSRMDRGIRLGAYLTAFEAASRRAVEAVSTAKRSDRRAVEAMARGRLRYAAVLRALAEQDDDAVATNLRHACHLLPGLSRQPAGVARRIRRVIYGREEYARALAAAAELWPDQTADTALFLRMKAASAALRCGRPSTALRLLRRLPARPAIRFVVGNVPLWRRLARGAIRRRIHRGRDRPIWA